MTVGVAEGPPVIVVADRDSEIRETVRDFMSARGYRVEPAADADAAVGLLAAGRVDVLVSELALRRADGSDLVAQARAAAPATRWIAIATDATPRERDAALRLGALRVLAKPLSLLELADAISLAHDCAEGFHGWMHRMSLIDVLQMYHHTGQSLVLRVRGEVDGAIALRHGELIHAETGEEVGMPALVELLAMPRGAIETAALDRTSRTLNGPFDHVLLDGLRALDERGRPRRPTTVPPTFGGWFEEPTSTPTTTPPAIPIDLVALQRWLGEHAPGAGAWLVDPVAPAIDRIDPLGDHPEYELASAPGAMGWAHELAERADPTWTRVELITGGTAVALIRVSGVVIGFARLVSGEAVLRRFQVESAQLVRWLTEHVRGAR